MVKGIFVHKFKVTELIVPPPPLLPVSSVTSKIQSPEEFSPSKSLKFPSGLNVPVIVEFDVGKFFNNGNA